MKRFTKTLSTLVLVTMLVLSLVGCQSTSAPVEIVPEIVEPVVELPEAPAPVVEAPAVEEPVAEEPVVEEPAKAEPVYGAISVYGYPLSYKVEEGKATVTYPSFVTNAEVAEFLGYTAAKNSALVEGVTFRVTAPGTVEIYYPAAATLADVEYVGTIVVGDLFEYVNLLFAAPAEEPVEIGRAACRERV